MSVTAERPAEVARDRAHIGALAAFSLEHRFTGLSRDQIEPVDMDRARFNLEGFAFARKIVGARASDADSGEGRRRLENGPDEAREEALNLGWGGTPIRACDDLSFGVVGRAFLAPAHAEPVGFGSVLNDGHGLGRLAESDRQHPRRERSERSGVACFPGVEQELDSPDRLSRGDPGRLIEIDPAVDLESRRSLLPWLSRTMPFANCGTGVSVCVGVAGHSLSSPPTSFRSRATAGDLRSSSMRA